MNDIFKAIADPTRREILLMLAEQPANVNRISERFNISRPAISKHIKILEDCKLVGIEKEHSDGRQRLCFAQLEAMQEVQAYIQQLEKFWANRLGRLGAYLEQQKREEQK
jgi:DNA-binding transcriptional ArsR family regulator